MSSDLDLNRADAPASVSETSSHPEAVRAQILAAYNTLRERCDELTLNVRSLQDGLEDHRSTAASIAAEAQGIIAAQAEEIEHLRRINNTLRDRISVLDELIAAMHTKYNTLRAALGGTRVSLFLARDALLNLTAPARNLLTWVDRLSAEIACNADAEGNVPS
uniref:Uncharacterized protein n=1 Tax=Mycena chlorophos TaxID=658473 RepID=A0ABQ0MB36_MYCCL|nr:predicted protein [Mycena chlorophos]